ncbi:Gfo/Idh/MocA family oxidoreductase [Gottschalkiaceae bacterium SANA]|nr:Gfo/Idh/MocA family oxidoreductase [Gottschalkiaceae bacterium SANA]
MIGYSVIGYGGIAKTHLMGLNNFRALELDLPLVEKIAMVGTRQTPDNEKQACDLEFSYFSADRAKVLADEKVDVVDICAPNKFHAPFTIEALEAGKNVYCEKPFAMNRSEIAAIGQALKTSSGIMQASYNKRFLPAFSIARAAIRFGVLGKITSFRVEYYHSSYLNPEKAYAWRMSKEASGGGALADLGSHATDLVRFVLGEVDSVLTDIRTVVKERKDSKGESFQVDVEDWVMSRLVMQSGAVGSVEASRVAVGNEGFRFEVYGEKGSFIIEPFIDPWKVNYTNALGQVAQILKESYEEDAFFQLVEGFYPKNKLFTHGWMLDSHTASLASFIKRIETGVTLEGIPTFEEASRTDAVLEAGYESAESGNIIKVTYGF